MKREIYSVGALNQYIKQLFVSDYGLNNIYVRGEVSNCKYHTSGHIYFTLKDRGSALACVMFSGQRQGLSFRLLEGQQVVVYGSVSVYERDGKYQLYARQIDLDGQGQLWQRFEALKKKLETLGFFDAAHKKKIPSYPKKIGIVTAKTGAAIQDIINISSRRNPFIQLVLYPATVQGQGAAPTIVRGIKALDAYGVDTIIVGRGGGSIEDLWAFNEESVAKAIFDCQTPVISAVGHETDITIADFVADLRAPTPSAAAELAVPDVRVLLANLSDMEDKLDQLLIGKVHLHRQYLEQYRLRLSHLSPKSQVREKRLRLMDMEERLSGLANRVLERKKHERDLYLERLSGLSPLARLSGGYACVMSGKGQLVRSVEDVSAGDILTVSVADGDIKASVIKTTKLRRNAHGEGKNIRNSI
ncbi:MAG: exodeoxyribonuclease VII large subunit [Clostridiales bacterium]|nr:exodeoxyribonuclease VII large subunit [Clostridiales bacterium]